MRTESGVSDPPEAWATKTLVLACAASAGAHAGLIPAHLQSEPRPARGGPAVLPRAAARQMVAKHLGQVIEQAVDELTGHYAAGARAFAPYIRHILDMADMISGGIIQQFPARFR